MDKRVQEFARLRWRIAQWVSFIAAVSLAVTMLVLHDAGTLKMWVLPLAYGELCFVLLGFVIWYTRWYFSDAFVQSAARRALGCRPEFADEVVAKLLADHPRADDIKQEIERQRGH